MDEEKLGVSVIDSAGKCDSILELGESSVIVGGEREETASLEDETVAVGGRMEGSRENHAAPEFVGEAAADKVKIQDDAADKVKIQDDAAEDGGSEVIASEDGDPIIAPQEKGVNRVDYAEREAVVAEGVTAPVSDESLVNEEGDKPVTDSELEMKTEEEIVPVLDAKLETDVTDSESQMDARGDEIHEDPQLETKGEKEFRPVVDPKMEVVDTDAGYEQQLAELKTDGGGGELNPVMEGTEAMNDKHERELGDEEHVAALGGVDNESVERMMADNYAETSPRSDDVAEEKDDFMVNDSKFTRAEKSTEVEEEKGNPEVMAEVPVTEVETDGSVHLANVCEQEQPHESSDGMEDVSVHERNEHAEDKVVAAEENQMCGTKMVEDENFSMKVSSDAKLDEHLNEAEYKEHVLVKADLPSGDIKLEEEARVESEMTRNAEVDHLSEDAEVDTEMGTNSIDSKTPDNDGKLETEDTMSDVDETAQDMYDSPGALQDEEDETVVAEEETGTQDTEMETETDMAESGKTSGGKRKRAKLSKSPSITKATTRGSSRKTVGEDVCFICFDGGELVLCDRR